MGRIKTKTVKSKSFEIMDAHVDKLNGDFTHNKKTISQIAEFRSKKLRNVMAGYLTRLMRERASKQK